MPIKREKAPLKYTGATTKKELRYVDAISKLVGVPGLLPRSTLLRPQKVVWIGVVIESCRNMSFVDIKKHASLRSHGSLPTYQEEWYRMPWRDRHGWLLLTESVVNDTEFFLNEYNLKLLKDRIDDLEVFFEKRGGKLKGPEKLGRGGFLP